MVVCSLLFVVRLSVVVMCCDLLSSVVVAGRCLMFVVRCLLFVVRCMACDVYC